MGVYEEWNTFGNLSYWRRLGLPTWRGFAKNRQPYFDVIAYVYCVPSRVWTVPSLCSWKFWKIQDSFDPDGQLDSIAPRAIESNYPSGSKLSWIFQNFHEHRDGAVHTLDRTQYSAVIYVYPQRLLSGNRRYILTVTGWIRWGQDSDPRCPR